VDCGYVGVVQGGEDFSFALETGQTLSVLRELIREDLDGNVAVEVGVFGTIDLSHAALTKLLRDAVVRDGLADHDVLSPLFGEVHPTDQFLKSWVGTKRVEFRVHLDVHHLSVSCLESVMQQSQCLLSV
jgi:hypothetical protein